MHKCFKKGLILAVSVGIIAGGSIHARAAEVSEQTVNPAVSAKEMLQRMKKTEEEKKDSIIIEETKEDQFTIKDQNEKYKNTSFIVTEEESICVHSVASDESDRVGKLYPGNAVTLMGPVGEWAAVTSGNVTGFIRSEYLADVEEAGQKIRKMEAEALKNGTEVIFSYGETKEEEEARLQEEAERRAKEEEERKQAQRQSVVDFACQFSGNPYVWGGTSLTNGADCSGFVQAVYAHFGVSLPRTSSAQRSAGYEVTYSEVQPGDIICYSGHVGIYAGNGQIINAQDPAHGIGLSPANYTSILTVRRIF